MNEITADFLNLTPDKMINAVESALDMPMTGFTSPLPSYINRVYELQAADGNRLIGKFYRPGRWTRKAIFEEHEFMSDCFEVEVPVILPMKLQSGSTLGEVDGIYFAVFPKKMGREFEVTSDSDWRRIGMLLGRMHNAGQSKPATERVVLHPLKSTTNDIGELIEGNHLSPPFQSSFKNIGDRIVGLSEDLFNQVETIRIHGDCHSGNVLFRPEEGLMLIDFDDMMTGPPIQDFWLLLPDYVSNCALELDLMIEGYEVFRDFDRNMLRMVEPLRAMRIIYFIAWCARQSNDLVFRKNFPDWGSENYWNQEIKDLNVQLELIEKLM